jgi:septum formation topological specificity factor MinE
LRDYHGASQTEDSKATDSQNRLELANSHHNVPDLQRNIPLDVINRHVKLDRVHGTICVSKNVQSVVDATFERDWNNEV